MSEPDLIAREVVVRGLVQGVFFRDSCRRLALDVGARGWVSNEPDGSVRAYLEGPAPAVEKVLSWMHQGPPRAAVDSVRSTEREPAGVRGFVVR
jgi:acylphosphatase